MIQASIPKIVHYVWVGRNPKPKLILKCIESWKRYLPDYTIIEWNEDNFDFSINKYVQQAYEAKKWAFVSDYMRLYVLYTYGGIYMDADVEVLKPLDEFLKLGAFTGFERDDSPITGIIGSVKEHTWIIKLLEYYDDKEFIKSDGTYDTTTNVTIISNITKKEFGVKLNGKHQILNNDLHIFPSEWFCPLNYATLKLDITQNSCAIHHFNGSWLNKRQKTKKLIRKLIDYRIISYLKNIKNNFK